jgi:hypothetical protein
VREALHQRRPSSHGAQERLGDGEVVVDEVELGLAAVCEEDLVRACHGDVSPADVEDVLLHERDCRRLRARPELHEMLAFWAR